MDVLHTTGAADLTKGVAKKAVYLSLPALCAALAFLLINGGSPYFISAGIILGAGLGVMNFNWLAQAVERLYLRGQAKTTASGLMGRLFTVFKLSAVFIILFFVIKTDVVHVIGLVIGLSVSFAAVIWEGLTIMSNMRIKHDKGAKMQKNHHT